MTLPLCSGLKWKVFKFRSGWKGKSWCVIRLRVYEFVLRIGCDVLRQDLDVINGLALCGLCILSYKNILGYPLGIVAIGWSCEPQCTL